MRQTRFDPDTPSPSSSLSLNSSSSLKQSLAPKAPPASAYRKDLAQTVLPLVIDPITLTAEVKATLKVPGDIIPTLRKVPGGGVEMRYYVEVIMDIRGKLGRLDEILTSDSGSKPGDTPGITDGMIETERIRQKEKSCVACKFEVVVGSLDSSSSKKRQLARTPAQVDSGRRSQTRDDLPVLQLRRDSGSYPSSPTSQHRRSSSLSYRGSGSNTPIAARTPILTPQPERYLYGYDFSPPDEPHDLHLPPTEAAPSYEPPPVDSIVAEKSRLEGKADALMESAPPVVDNWERSSGARPSAPVLDVITEGVAFASAGPSAGPSMPAGLRFEAEREEVDKQERERERLMAAESEPPVDEDREVDVGPVVDPAMQAGVDGLPVYSR